VITRPWRMCTHAHGVGVRLHHPAARDGASTTETRQEEKVSR